VGVRLPPWALLGEIGNRRWAMNRQIGWATVYLLAPGISHPASYPWHLTRMPELPEVEILVKLLNSRLKGARIVALDVPDTKITLAHNIVGRRIRDVRRRGKNIIFNLSRGLHLLVHLRMTGWFEFDKPKRYRAAIRTGKGTAYFEDGRRLGVMQVLTTLELGRALAALGPDSLADPGSLTRLAKTSRPIKVALLDQQLVAGVGNIYASESLWRAQINPRRRANRLAPAEVRAIHRGIAKSMRQAINYGPRIFELQRFSVYGREGELCRRCGTRIRRVIQAQRSTFFCPACQR
jgi:formamidopyrimidine-DNA glycosylase